MSVDLLVVLLADEDSAIRKAAMEVYLRRVYRAHSIKTLTISDNDGIISAEWAFTNRYGVLALRLNSMYSHHQDDPILQPFFDLSSHSISPK